MGCNQITPTIEPDPVFPSEQIRVRAQHATASIPSPSNAEGIKLENSTKLNVTTKESTALNMQCTSTHTSYVPTPPSVLHQQQTKKDNQPQMAACLVMPYEEREDSSDDDESSDVSLPQILIMPYEEPRHDRDEDEASDGSSPRILAMPYHSYSTSSSTQTSIDHSIAGLLRVERKRKKMIQKRQYNNSTFQKLKIGHVVLYKWNKAIITALIQK
eukprot:1011381_1